MWALYEVVFRLQSPLHIGWRKTGNLMQTRPYVPGKNLWAALTARLTRMLYGPAPDGEKYREVGKKVEETFVFTYFYPTLEEEKNNYRIYWPWNENFDYLFLGSRASTSLEPGQRAAAEGTLHEVEFIAPHTREGHPVFLKGYIFHKNSNADILNHWKEVLHHIQLGGERTYGWGRVDCISLENLTTTNPPVVFDQTSEVILSEEHPQVTFQPGTYLSAHAEAKEGVGNKVRGPVEPLVGREWGKRPGDTVAYAGVYFAPGSQVIEKSTWEITSYGILRLLQGDNE